MSIARARQQLKAAKKEHIRHVFSAVSMTTRDGLQKARRMSSGRRSSARLAQMDHPYATRHGKPLLPPEIINTQSGEFKAAWYMDSPKSTDGGKTISGSVINDSEVADYLEFGTKKMFARPLPTVVMDFTFKQLETRLQKSLDYLHNTL